MDSGRIQDKFGMSILGDIQNFTGQSPRQPGLVGSAKSLPALNYSLSLCQQLFSVFNELRGREKARWGRNGGGKQVSEWRFLEMTEPKA